MRSTSRYRERFSNSGIRCFALRRTRTGFTVELGGTAQLRPIVLLVLFAKYNGAFFNVQCTDNVQCTIVVVRVLPAIIRIKKEAALSLKLNLLNTFQCTIDNVQCTIVVVRVLPAMIRIKKKQF